MGHLLAQGGDGDAVLEAEGGGVLRERERERERERRERRKRRDRDRDGDEGAGDAGGDETEPSNIHWSNNGQILVKRCEQPEPRATSQSNGGIGHSQAWPRHGDIRWSNKMVKKGQNGRISRTGVGKLTASDMPPKSWPPNMTRCVLYISYKLHIHIIYTPYKLRGRQYARRREGGREENPAE
jgi:hypothetical protein